MLPIFVVISTVLLNAIAYKILTSARVNRVLAISIYFAQLIWYTVPAFISVVDPTLLEGIFRIGRIPIERFYMSYIMEATTALVALCLFYQFTASRRSNCSMPIFDRSVSFRTDFFIVSVCLLVMIHYAATASFDYVERNAMAIVSGADRAFLLHQVLSVPRKFLITYVLLIFIEQRKGSSLGVYAYLVLLFYAAIYIAAGARIYLFLPVVALLIKSIKGSRMNLNVTFRRLAALGLVGLATLPLLYGMQKSRQKAEGAIGMFAYTDGFDADIALHMLMTKLDSFSKGRVLIERASAGSAGYRPYVGSALVFVPRLILPSRPVAGSTDGTYAGTPGRLVPRLQGRISDALNAGVSPVHVAIWHFGYVFGVVSFVAATVAYLSLLNQLLTSDARFERVIAVYMLAIPTFAGILTSPDAVLRNSVMLFCFVVLARLAKATCVAARRAVSLPPALVPAE